MGDQIAQTLQIGENLLRLIRVDMHLQHVVGADHNERVTLGA